jgi:hypothetical protein
MNSHFIDIYNIADISSFEPKVNLAPKTIYLHLKDQKDRDLGAEPVAP